jgi:prepilin-type N-terminal cleavage/methylation domain-containing protein
MKGLAMTESDQRYLPKTPARRRGFTTIEILAVLMIMAITATIALDLISETEANAKAERAAREACTALLYARSMAISYGGGYGVEFDTANKRFQVFLTTGSNVVTQPLSGSGTYVISLTRPELSGIAMTPTIAGDTTNPYDVTFAPLGSTTNSGTVAFTYAGKTKTVTIPKLGAPTIN